MRTHWLKPDWEPGMSLPNLPHQHFLEKNLKAIILDVDKTLLAGRQLVLHKSVIDWVTMAQADLKLYIISNNPSKYRIESVGNQLGIPFSFGASKPRKESLLKVIDKLKLNAQQVAIIGDRIFTDVLGGNRVGLYTVLVKPIGIDGNPSKNDSVQKLEKFIAELLGADRP